MFLFKKCIGTDEVILGPAMVGKKLLYRRTVRSLSLVEWSGDSGKAG